MKPENKVTDHPKEEETLFAEAESSDKKIARNKSFIESFNNAVIGIATALKAERNLKFHFLAALLVIILVLPLNLTKVEMITLSITICLVLVSELINTALEQLVDLVVGDQWHPLAKKVKDIAAGAVLISAFSSIFVGYLIFGDRLLNFQSSVFSRVQRSPAHLGFIITAFVLLLVVILKSILYKGKGTPFQGGTVSGHTALAFSFATMITLLSQNLFIAFLAYSLALLVAESRLEGRFHTPSEAIAGALIGLVLTIIVFRFGQLR